MDQDRKLDYIAMNESNVQEIELEYLKFYFDLFL